MPEENQLQPESWPSPHKTTGIDVYGNGWLPSGDFHLGNFCLIKPIMETHICISPPEQVCFWSERGHPLKSPDWQVGG